MARHSMCRKKEEITSPHGFVSEIRGEERRGYVYIFTVKRRDFQVFPRTGLVIRGLHAAEKAAEKWPVVFSVVPISILLAQVCLFLHPFLQFWLRVEKSPCGKLDRKNSVRPLVFARAREQGYIRAQVSRARAVTRPGGHNNARK